VRGLTRWSSGARIDLGIDIVGVGVVEASVAYLVKRFEHAALFVDYGGLFVSHVLVYFVVCLTSLLVLPEQLYAGVRPRGSVPVKSCNVEGMISTLRIVLLFSVTGGCCLLSTLIEGVASPMKLNGTEVSLVPNEDGDC